MIVLSLNAGSSSLRYGVYNVTDSAYSLLLEGAHELPEKLYSSEEIHVKAFQEVTRKIFLEIKDTKIDAIGCRVVHGGPTFSESVIIDANTLQAVRHLKALAPLHNAIDAAILESSLQTFPSIPTVAVFDTAFHHALPPESTQYGLPLELSKKYNLRRYGFHGIAHQFVSNALLTSTKKAQTGSRCITCHLGNGASVCAIKDGKSFDTSMGFTPLEGLLMGTRSGDIDPGLILYLIEECKMTPSELETILNHKSGLLGLSGLSSDVRELEQAAQNGNKEAAFALEAFAYRVAKYIGSYVVALGGIDAIAFSGGIGENSTSMRERICKKIACLGVAVRKDLNNQIGANFCITSNESSLPVWVIHADENSQIAKLTYATVQHVLKESA